MLEWQKKQPRFQVRWLKGGKQIFFGLLTASLLETNQCEEFQFVIGVNPKTTCRPNIEERQSGLLCTQNCVGSGQQASRRSGKEKAWQRKCYHVYELQ
jgi:hypothetical protein